MELATINTRLDALEASVRDMRGYAKEIDELRMIVRSLEARVEQCEKK